MKVGDKRWGTHRQLKASLCVSEASNTVAKSEEMGTGW